MQDVSANYYGILVASLDESGTWMWAKSYDDNVNAQDYIYSISKLNDNQISINGALCAGTGSLCTVDFDTFEYTVQSPFSSSIFCNYE